MFVDKQIIEKVLRTLTPRFEHTVVEIRNPKILKTWKWRSCKIPLSCVWMEHFNNAEKL